jgi:HK97 family phage major capsid protein
MTGLFDTAQAESRDFSEDEQKKYDAAEKEFNRLKAAKETVDTLADRATVVEPDPDPDPDPVEPVPEPASNAGAQNQRISAGDNLATQRPYDSLGMMLIDVAGTKIGNVEAMDRLVKASLNTETGADGGFLVPPDFIGGLLTRAIELSQLYSRVTELTILGNTANLPAVDETSRADGSRFGGIQVYWLREGGEGTYKQPKFRNLDLKLSKLMGLVSITDEMLEDSALLTSWVQSAFPAEMAFSLDQAVYDGDGNGKPLGIMNSGALVVVAKEASQTADTIVYENIVKMWARMPAARMARAVWLITQQAMEQLPLMKIDVGTGGGPVYLPAGGASERPFSTLMGRPIIPIEQAATLGDQGDIVLADLSDYIAITKGGLKTASSIHVDFDKAKTSFRFIRRINGAPYTRIKLQSRASSTFYTSPYITLAERA